MTPLLPSYTDTATASADLNVTATGALTSQYQHGYLSVLNDGFDHEVTLDGVFVPLGESGGQAIVSIPVTVSPFIAGGLTISLGANVSTSNLGQGTASGAGSISATALNFGFLEVTLADGTPLSGLGVTYTFSPSAAVPEPPGLAMVTVGLIMGAAVTARWPGDHP